jgi:hypothetical protein
VLLGLSPVFPRPEDHPAELLLPAHTLPGNEAAFLIQSPVVLLLGAPLLVVVLLLLLLLLLLVLVLVLLLPPLLACGCV